ncbi:MAG: hypothetical protein F6J92_41890, partial [Symploca sp. SIO1A3]|nr:hypothetical protein [Symploca sp. SIO1A3]
MNTREDNGDPFDQFEHNPITSVSQVPITEEGIISPPQEPSSFTRHLIDLQHRVPVVGDKALIDLVNG